MYCGFIVCFLLYWSHACLSATSTHFKWELTLFVYIVRLWIKFSYSYSYSYSYSHKGPVTQSFGVFDDLRLSKRLKQCNCQWFYIIRRRCNVILKTYVVPLSSRSRCKFRTSIIKPCHNVSIRDQSYWHDLTYIPAWMNEYIHCRSWDEITHPFPNFNGCILNNVSHPFLSMCLRIHAGIKVNRC